MPRKKSHNLFERWWHFRHRKPSWSSLDIKMRFCQRRQSHISCLRPPRSPTERRLSETTSRFRSGEDEKGLPAGLRSAPSKIFGSVVGMVFVPVAPTQPYWLSCSKCWLRKRMPLFVKLIIS